MLTVRVIRFSRPSLRHGVVNTAFEGVPARITSPARTVVDSFRFSQLVGKDTAIEALRDSLCVRNACTDEIWRKAEAFRANSLDLLALDSLLA